MIGKKKDSSYNQGCLNRFHPFELKIISWLVKKFNGYFPHILKYGTWMPKLNSKFKTIFQFFKSKIILEKYI